MIIIFYNGKASFCKKKKKKNYPHKISVETATNRIIFKRHCKKHAYGTEPQLKCRPSCKELVLCVSMEQ